MARGVGVRHLNAKDLLVGGGAVVHELEGLRVHLRGGRAGRGPDDLIVRRAASAATATSRGHGRSIVVGVVLDSEANEVDRAAPLNRRVYAFDLEVDRAKHVGEPLRRIASGHV